MDLSEETNQKKPNKKATIKWLFFLYLINQFSYFPNGHIASVVYV